MILDNRTIESINIQMLGLGAPVDRDDKGYNKPDYNKMYRYYFGVSDYGLKEICETLVKYASTQLSGVVSKQDLLDTINHFASKGVKETDSITGIVTKIGILLSFRYDTDIINLIRKLPKSDREFKNEIKSWLINYNSIENLLKSLEDNGYDIKGLTSYLESNNLYKEKIEESRKNRAITEEQQRLEKKYKFKVSFDEYDATFLHFDYDYKVVDRIRSLPDSYRRWDNIKRGWRIHEDEVIKLMLYFNQMADIDVSNVLDDMFERFPYLQMFYKLQKKEITKKEYEEYLDEYNARQEYIREKQRELKKAIVETEEEEIDEDEYPDEIPVEELEDGLEDEIDEDSEDYYPDDDLEEKLEAEKRAEANVQYVDEDDENADEDIDNIDIEAEYGKVRGVFFKVIEDSGCYRIRVIRPKPYITRAIKSIPDYKLDKNHNDWVISRQYITNLYYEMCSLGKSILASDTVAKENVEMLKDFFPRYIQQLVNLNEIKAVLFGSKLLIQAPLSSLFTDIITKFKSASFYQDKGMWWLHKTELSKLIEELEIRGIADTYDITSLKQISKTIEIQKKIFSAKTVDFSHMSRAPFAHQLEASDFLLEHQKCILADEMGGGKTMSSLLASYSLKQHIAEVNVQLEKVNNPTRFNSITLIICPASLKLNWVDEIRLVDKNADICVAEGGIIRVAEYIVVNYDILDRHLGFMLQHQPTCVIIDEAHFAKAVTDTGRPKTTRAEMCINICGFAKHVYLLTGTPLLNRPADLYNLLVMIDSHLALNFFEFGLLYCEGHQTKQGWSFTGSSNSKQLHEELQKYMLRRLKKDMLDLPDKLRSYNPVEVDLATYNKMLFEYMRERELKISNRVKQLVQVNAMKKFLAYEKVKTTIELAENVIESEGAVVIFTDYQQVVDDVMAHFKSRARKITGKDDMYTKKQTVDDFQAGKYPVIVLNMKAGGVGLTLTRASTLLFNDLNWVPFNLFQAEDRIHRIGQKDKVTIIYSYCKNASIDEKLIAFIEYKSKIANEVIDGGNNEEIEFDCMDNIMTSIFNDYLKSKNKSIEEIEHTQTVEPKVIEIAKQVEPLATQATEVSKPREPIVKPNVEVVKSDEKVVEETPRIIPQSQIPKVIEPVVVTPIERVTKEFSTFEMKYTLQNINVTNGRLSVEYHKYNLTSKIGLIFKLTITKDMQFDIKLEKFLIGKTQPIPIPITDIKNLVENLGFIENMGKELITFLVKLLQNRSDKTAYDALFKECCLHYIMNDFNVVVLNSSSI